MFRIEPMSRIPVYEQIIEQLERFVLSGIMSKNDQLPSVRSLSCELSINPNTIQKAYSELDRKGIIYSVPGKGCFISEQAKEILSEHTREKMKGLKDLIKELLLAGISRKEMHSCIDDIYDGKVESND